MNEFDIQKTFHDWCCKQSYILEHWHVPNGMHSSAKACSLMKKIGLRKGVCDYWILLNNKKLLAIEFKDACGELSLEQQRFIKHLNECEIPVAVCRSPFEASMFVKNYYMNS